MSNELDIYVSSSNESLQSLSTALARKKERSTEAEFELYMDQINRAQLHRELLDP